MYPRVKVMVKEHQTSAHEETTSDQLIRVIESLSLEGHSSLRTPPPRNGRHCENRPPSADGKYLKSPIKKSPMPCVSTTKGSSTDKLNEDAKSNQKAGLLSRPRAPLSSPDNDDLIGYQNRLIEERHAEMRKRRMNQRMKYHMKSSPENARAESLSSETTEESAKSSSKK